MFVGLLLLMMGVLMLLEKLDIIYGDTWDYFVPIAIIALGASFIFKDKKEAKPK
ncbi:MAG: DUF5668 domain-containing protein [bacterium]|nr:DUF5668 domain-containing protein [bacterium]